MEYLGLYIDDAMSLYEIGKLLKALPSPRRQFFDNIVAVSGLSPNSVKMMLSSTVQGYIPRKEIREKIATNLGKDVDELFSDDRKNESSLYSLYIRLKARKVEYNEFVHILSKATGVTPKTVTKWLANKKIL